MDEKKLWYCEKCKMSIRGNRNHIIAHATKEQLKVLLNETEYSKLVEMWRRV